TGSSGPRPNVRLELFAGARSVLVRHISIGEAGTIRCWKDGTAEEAARFMPVPAASPGAKLEVRFGDLEPRTRYLLRAVHDPQAPLQAARAVTTLADERALARVKQLNYRPGGRARLALDIGVPGLPFELRTASGQVLRCDPA